MSGRNRAAVAFTAPGLEGVGLVPGLPLVGFVPGLLEPGFAEPGLVEPELVEVEVVEVVAVELLVVDELAVATVLPDVAAEPSARATPVVPKNAIAAARAAAEVRK